MNAVAVQNTSLVALSAEDMMVIFGGEEEEAPNTTNATVQVSQNKIELSTSAVLGSGGATVIIKR